ncbi:MAG: GNAT family N-acetyltransferase [Thermomicrobiales bacterium]
MQIYLETERLLLRRFTPADVENLVELDSDPAVMHYLNGGVPTPRDIIERDILPRFLASYDEMGEFGRWAAIEKATGEFLGWFSFRSHDDAHLDDVELGYRLRQASWGRGYATEGAQALIRRGFTDLGVRRVYATTYQDNRASRRVMEKVGLTFVRAYRPTPDEVAAVGTFQPAAADVWDGDEVEYALEKSAWERHEAAGAPPVARADNRGIA